MQVSVSGKKMDVGASLKTYVEDKIASGVKKYFDNAVDANVVFHKDAHLFKADVIVNEGTGNGIVIKGNGESADVYAAFDQASERIEKQLRRYKRRIKSHHKTKFSDLGKADVVLLSAKKYVLREDAEIESPEEDNPLIIAEKPTPIQKLTVSEAVMEMNLQNLPTLMFINKSSGAFNVVYHRKDGNISWIDPQRSEK